MRRGKISHRLEYPLAEYFPLFFFQELLLVHLIDKLFELRHVCFLPKSRVLGVLAITISTDEFTLIMKIPKIK